MDETNRSKLERLIIGRQIVGIEWDETSHESYGDIVLSIILDNGSKVKLLGSDQIGVSAVWLEIEDK
jgi:hypothetical protein